MTMTRTMKEQQVAEIRKVFDEANSLYLVDLTGLSSNEINGLRAELRQRGARMRVVKNRLAKRAAADHSFSSLEKWFTGPTALVYHQSEPVATAKGLMDFAKDNPALQVKAGIIDRGETVDAEGVKTVSALPSMDEARAMLLSLVLAPMTRLVRLIGTPATQVARVIGEKSKME
ncbi:MAG: 50S ribosomal protein L10 [Acidobacteriota bacterium]|nr:50S ribosomal protein L10 [Acidobacteriota bacterium]